MLQLSLARILLVAMFTLGYLLIILEYRVKVNKTASALFTAVVTWMILFLVQGEHLVRDLSMLAEKFSEVSQIIFFLLGAMTLVELIDSHKGFRVITDLIQTGSKKRLLWVLGAIAFVLSAILDNLTATIVMISLLRKLVPDKKERMVLSAMVVIAANTGGAFSPIGDITTTMLWINGNLTAPYVIGSLVVPSAVSLVVALLLLGKNLKGRYPHFVQRAHEEKVEPGARLVFFAGVGGLLFVPVFKGLTGLPPFMGMLISLSILWFITDLLHRKHATRQHLLVPQVLTRIDTSGILFFLGILLSIHALEMAGLLMRLAHFLDTYVANLSAIAILIGLISAVIDNIPLVAATMGMYSLDAHPVNSFLWMMIAFCAGTGGSILIVGSAAGVALMGMEKIDFIWYVRKISLIALLSYLAGIGIYSLQYLLLGF